MRRRVIIKGTIHSKRRLIDRINALSGTHFQKRVWRALLEIPQGEVRTYEWVARKIGSPKSARAVGSALKKNPLAPEVPCHRVIRKNGQMGGYSGVGGIKLKVALLKKEGFCQYGRRLIRGTIHTP